MIAFIVAFRHPNSTKNYNHVVQLLQATIESLLNQTNDDFKVYIGCNEVPEIDVDDSKVRFCPIDCPLPNNRKEVLLDKGVKRAFAIQTANTEIAPEYFFLLDADDLVRNDCVEYLCNQRSSGSTGGYWLERGYLLDMFNRKAQEKYGFNRYCGSSLILSAKVLTNALFSGKEFIKPMTLHDEFMNACDPYVLEQVLGDHIAVRRYMASLNHPLQKIVRPLTCWKINTGENESKTKIPFGSKNMNRKFLEAFSVPQEYERNTHVLEAIVERYRFIVSWIASKWASYK